MWRWLVAGCVLAAVIAVVLVRSCGKPATHATPPATRRVIAPSHASGVTGDAAPLPKPPPGGLRLEGQVIDEGDQPVANVKVRFYNFDHETATGDDGSFVFEHLGAHEYQVIADSEDTWCEMVRVELTETTEPVILRIHPAATALVHVSDAETGKPIEGARLSGRVTDAAGDVRVHGLRPGGNNIWIIGVDADGYEHGRVKLTGMDLGTPSDNVFQVALHRGVAIRGTVLDVDGTPLAGATIDASAEGHVTSEVESDSTGAWTVTLAPGSFELVATATDRSASQAVTVEVAAEPKSGFVLRLQKRIDTKDPVLSGIVVDVAGKPVAGATVDLSTEGMSWHEETDADGHFTTTVFAGATSLTASARKGTLASPDTTVTVGAEARLVIGPSTIAGVVVDTRGRPAPGVRVSSRYDFSDPVTISDAKGRFELGLVPGEYTLYAAHPEEEFARPPVGVEAKTGARDVRIVVTDVGSVSGRVVLDGKPVPYFGAYIEEADVLHDRPTIVRSQDGRFAIKGIVGGTWTLVLAGPSFGRKSVKAVVPEDDNVDLGDIAVDHGRTIRGRVTDANGAVAGATVSVHERELPRDSLSRAVEGTGTATTDASGAYRIGGLAPSLYNQQRRIFATHPTRGVSVDRPLADTDTEVNLTIAKPGAIEGRLEGMDTGVLCNRVDDDYHNGVSPDDKGNFKFENLAPGAYRVRPNGLTAVFAIVNVVSGQRAKVSLVVPREHVEIEITGASCKSVTLSTEDGDDELATGGCGISNVPPGRYRACGDGRCTKIDVAATPAKQTFAIVSR